MTVKLPLGVTTESLPSFVYRLKQYTDEALIRGDAGVMVHVDDLRFLIEDYLRVCQARKLGHSAEMRP